MDLEDFDPLSTNGGILSNAADIFKRAGKHSSEGELKASEIFPAKSTTYYLDLARRIGEPLLRQVLPSAEELIEVPGDMEDSLDEDNQSPCASIVHRYPDRCLLFVSNECAMYCRFCTRKRKVASDKMAHTLMDIMVGLDYIRNNEQIRDVIISGGDPLMQSTERLEWIIHSLFNISHVEIVRIGTRVPCVFPQRITPGLCQMLKKYKPLYMNVHFAHPAELTTEACKALDMLADAGLILGNQCVLLKGVNDSPEIMQELNKKLLKNRVKPYIMYQMDKVIGGNHFKTSIQTGLDIIKDGLRGWTSGLAVPHYIIDAPGGKGKCPILPEYAKVLEDGSVQLTNYKNETSTY